MNIDRCSLKEYKILLPSCACNTGRFAAEELEKYVKKMTGIALPVVMENKAGSPVFTFEKSFDKEIRFDGTIEEWNSLSKNTDWYYNASHFTVVCTDGEIEY